MSQKAASLKVFDMQYLTRLRDIGLTPDILLNAVPALFRAQTHVLSYEISSCHTALCGAFSLRPCARLWPAGAECIERQSST